MQTKQTAERDFIDGWILEELIKGKTIEEMNGTTFVFGKELLTLKRNAEGSFDVEPLETKDIVIIQEEGKMRIENMCDKCGTEHQTFKEVIQCCEDIE
ncbi:hypothetical protein D4T97_007715 [Siminovitchia acidinfaciens]|uniref:Uncharacterized protein n=1 Tax=Siminovitchia acidinfaciens TaxID=2321395 RepID=A0A429Y1Q3_9BACI|nr:hypothetical protein [Siminovitchia acidinfaciens]RST75137.1 hypothetical protein D4T97_007715 [Siminovitchia acidinfaciens]VEF48787.1 Uncharacterised protein [Bacillus freudenreichii]